MSTTKKRQTSPAQAAAARANGAKSSGPTSPEGQLKSRSYRITHGFRSSTMALENENPDGYTEHLEAYRARYSPVDKLELDLVGLLATNMWQVMRMNSVEVALFNIELSNIDPELRRDYKNMDEWGRLALAFKKTNGDNALELLRRYKSTAERAYHRALQAIEDLRRPQTNSTDQPQPPTENPNPKPELFLMPDPIAPHEVHPDPEASNSTPQTRAAKIGRNEFCPCLSGLKFKRCCANNPQSTTTPDVPGKLPL